MHRRVVGSGQLERKVSQLRLESRGAVPGCRVVAAGFGRVLPIANGISGSSRLCYHAPGAVTFATLQPAAARLTSLTFAVGNVDNPRAGVATCGHTNGRRTGTAVAEWRQRRSIFPREATLT